MTDIPKTAVSAVAKALEDLDLPVRLAEGHYKRMAIVALETAEETWPHEPAKAAARDVASTTAAVTQVSVPEQGRHRFGFGPAHVTSAGPVT